VAKRAVQKATRQARRAITGYEDRKVNAHFRQKLLVAIVRDVKFVEGLKMGHNSMDISDLATFSGSVAQLTPVNPGDFGFDLVGSEYLSRKRPLAYDGTVSRGLAYADEAAAVVDRQDVYNVQGTTPVDLTTSAALDLETAGITWVIRDEQENDLFSITEGEATSDSTVQIATDVDVFDVDAASVDFFQGIVVDSGGTQIDIGAASAGVISSAGLLTLTAAGADLTLDGAGGEVHFDDSYLASSDWTTDPWPLSDSVAEWTALKNAYSTEGSLVNLLERALQTVSADTGSMQVDSFTVTGDNGLVSAISGSTLTIDLPSSYTPTAATDITDKAYVDSLINGVTWQDTVTVKDFVGNFTYAAIEAGIAGIAADMAVLSTTGGTITAGGITVEPGDIIQWDGSVWALIKEGDGTQPLAGTRAAIIDSAGTIPVSSTLVDGTDNSKLADWDGASVTPTLTTSHDGWAVIVSGNGAVSENTGFVMVITPVNDEALGDASPGISTYNNGSTPLVQSPVVPGTVVITSSSGGVWVDDGNGVLVANGAGASPSTDGGIDYSSGAWDINWSAVLPAGTHTITADYESSTDAGLWTQFTGTGGAITAGDGLTKSGSEISIDLGTNSGLTLTGVSPNAELFVAPGFGVEIDGTSSPGATAGLVNVDVDTAFSGANSWTNNHTWDNTTAALFEGTLECDGTAEFDGDANFSASITGDTTFTRAQDQGNFNGVEVGDASAVTAEAEGSTGAVSTYQFTLTNPADPGTVVIFGTVASEQWDDDGAGVLVANGNNTSLDGTIDYRTGDCEINWTATAGSTITADYDTGTDGSMVPIRDGVFRCGFKDSSNALNNRRWAEVAALTVRTGHLEMENPRGRQHGAWTLSENPTMIVAKNDLTGELRKVLTVALTDEELASYYEHS
jgi:hypothetical protein